MHPIPLGVKFYHAWACEEVKTASNGEKKWVKKVLNNFEGGQKVAGWKVLILLKM